MIKLFDVNKGKVIPTEHCYTLNALKNIMDHYPEEYLHIYAYLFYMTCPNPELNPFFNVPENDKEEIVLKEVKTSTWSTEDELIIEGITLAKKLYETPTYRAYRGISGMLDRLADYMETTKIEHGRDGNITALVGAAKNFGPIRESFKGAYKDLLEEQKSTVRGGARLGYDQ